MANVVIDIAAEFTGNKAFKQADSATDKLTKNVKKLAGAVGLAYSTQAIVSFGKAAVKAFAEDEAAALRLNRAVENLGIGFANPAIAQYISNLEKSAAVADDVLRPAFQGLLTTTGSLIQSQKLLNDAITISRASGIDLATVTEDLGKGYVGITRGLQKYNTGLTRAELQSKSFNEILGVILKRSAGAAEDYLGSTAYSMDVLGIATGNASEIIGGGLVDALALVGGGTEATDAAYVIENIATALAKVTVQAGRTVGVIPTLIKNLKNLPKNIFQGFAGAQLGVNVVIPEKKEEVKLTLTQKKQEELMAKLEKDSLRRQKEKLALLNKENSAKRLQGIIEKANKALGKGTGIFDMDQIQIAAALANQAEQLGNATSSAQVLQIANDTARLNVKKSMLALEEAIASKDEAAILAATKKLEADLGVLNALTGQNTKMTAIKSTLESLVPKDLINQQNLDDALRKIKEMLALLAGVSGGVGGISGGVGGTVGGRARSNDFGSGIPVNDYIAPITMADGLAASQSALLEYGDAAAERANAFALLLEQQNEYDELALNEFMSRLGLENLGLGGSRTDAAASRLGMPTIGVPPSNAGSTPIANAAAIQSGNRYAAQAAAAYNITVNTGIGDPNAIAEAIDNVLREARDRGTLIIE